MTNRSSFTRMTARDWRRFRHLTTEPRPTRSKCHCGHPNQCTRVTTYYQLSDGTEHPHVEDRYWCERCELSTTILRR